MISKDRLSQSIFKIGVICILVFLFARGLPMIRELKRISLFSGIRVGLQLKTISKIIDENRKSGQADPVNLQDFLKIKYPDNYQKLSLDPWKHNFILEKSQQTNEIIIYSCGKDGIPKSKDDFFILIKQ